MNLLKKFGWSVTAGKRVVLLPDHAFFVRVVPLPVETPTGEVPAQVELVLEGMSPFPISHLCYGYFRRPGSARVLVYAAYRWRFTVDDATGWAGAEVVLPSFAAWLGRAPDGPRALLVNGPDYLTLLAWDADEAVPSTALTRQVPADAPPDVRAAAQAALVAELPDGPPAVTVPADPPCLSGAGDADLRFSAGEVTSRFEAGEFAALDVRDKAELAARTRERRRDLMLWRVFQGALLALVLAVLLEAGLMAGGLWLRTRETIAAARAPAVQEIETKNSLADRIEDLSTRRLLPLEMVTAVGRKLQGSSIQFLRTTTHGRNVLEIEGQTNSAPDLSNYQAALKELPACEQVEVGQTTERGGVTRFTLTVTFKPGSLRPAVPTS